MFCFFPVLSLFTIVSFKNDACVSGTGNNGTCYSSSDCSKLGGTASGSCASGFGVCCLCKFFQIQSQKYFDARSAAALIISTHCCTVGWKLNYTKNSATTRVVGT